MSYYIAKSVKGLFDEAVSAVTAQLRARGFGVLTDIDVPETLKAKLGADMPKYRILGACNPRIVHQALQLEERLGVLLPCNVVVRETPDHDVEIVGIDPVSQMERTCNAALSAPAEEVRRLLADAINSVEG